jgi:hypothetical protein
MLWRGLRSIGLLGLLAFAPCLCLSADRTACPAPTMIGSQRVFIFPDGSIAMRTKLAVNPDGAFASYTVGDHGFTYLANAVDLWKDGRRHNCRDPNLSCRTQFLAAAARDFNAGTTEFCAFALEVEVNEGAELTPCRAGHVIGNAKGRPKKTTALSTVTGAMVTPYASTTSLMHKVQGVHVYIDSAQTPSLVSPRSADLGRVAWVRSRQFSKDTFVIVGDKGPAFGEGSIALSQLLRHGELKAQKPGPIELEHRCQASERDLEPPFVSRPDIAGDKCQQGRQPRGPADIRAVDELASVDSILLGSATFNVTGNRIDEELTAQSIAKRAADEQYTAARLQQMADCLQ